MAKDIYKNLAVANGIAKGPYLSNARALLVEKIFLAVLTGVSSSDSFTGSYSYSLIERAEDITQTILVKIDEENK